MYEVSPALQEQGSLEPDIGVMPPSEQRLLVSVHDTLLYQAHVVTSHWVVLLPRDIPGHNAILLNTSHFRRKVRRIGVFSKIWQNMVAVNTVTVIVTVSL